MTKYYTLESLPKNAKKEDIAVNEYLYRLMI